MGCGFCRSEASAKEVQTVAPSSLGGSAAESSTELLLSGAADGCEVQGHGSAQGKVLVTGGYLILFEGYTGLSLSLDAAVNCTVLCPQSAAKAESGVEIAIETRQWLVSTLRYSIDAKRRTLIDSQSAAHSSAFVTRTLQVFFSFIEHWPFGVVRMKLECDEAFGSGSRKRGFGASAAIVVALMRALFDALNQSTAFASDSGSVKRPPKCVLYALCQCAHFCAQNKVGSGFDVATALFGSIVFAKHSAHFSECVTAAVALIADDSTDLLCDTRKAAFRTLFAQLQASDCAFASVRIPRDLQLVFCDHSFGDTHTPSFVRSVLRWRESHSIECTQLFDAIQVQTDEISKLLRSDLTDQLCFAALSKSFMQIVDCQCKLSRFSEVPIAPRSSVSSLRLLLEGHSASAHCRALAFGFPGAGGNDCCFVLLNAHSFDAAIAHLRSRILKLKLKLRPLETVRLLPNGSQKGAKS